MTPEAVEAFFTRSDGTFRFARWGRPLAPVVFGVDDATLSIVKGAIEAVCRLAGHEMVEVDPELGANLMVFFCRDWAELTGVPDLDRLVPDLVALTGRLSAAGANQYRAFRFDKGGAIRAAIVFLCMDDELAAMDAETLALSQVVQTMLLWSDTAFQGHSPLAVAPGRAVVLRPEIAGLIRAAYDPTLAHMSQEPAMAFRLAARVPD